MQRIRCRNLWTGAGSCLAGVSVFVNDSGVISSIESCSDSTFDCNFAMPSFVDAHTHLTWMVVKKASLDLSQVHSAEELISLVSSAEPAAGGRIIRGESFDESDWTDAELPTLDQLDRAGGDVPVFLRRVCGHTALANSALLQLFDGSIPGVNRKTGVLKEWPVLNFERLFPLSDDVLTRAFSEVESEVFSHGVTGVFTFESPHGAELVLKSDPLLDLSVAVMVESVDDLPDDRLSVQTVKLFLDGSFGAENAALLYPYPSGAAGELHYSDSQLFLLLFRCGELGLSVAVHAIGGRALQQLDCVSGDVFKALGHGFGVRVEHAEELLHAWPGTWSREYHVFSMQPNFVERWQQPGGMYDTILTPDRAVVLNPFRTVVDSGFRLGFGSDSMPLDPLFGLCGAVDHRAASQSLSVHEALFAYTLGSASISGLAHLAVPLAAGRTADMVFLSGSPFEKMEGLAVEATMKNGAVVYGNTGIAKGI
ncbi:MAG: amidohydrolase family protein [Candidatus Fermentibacteraceae bacterium]|nr:amidohydrolase family protein [Candidatus Fermentibacteraceae bacterium]